MAFSLRRLVLALAVCLLAAGGGAARAEPAYVWKNVAVGGGGFMPNIVFSRVEKGLAYLRSDMGGIYRFDARAGRWRPLQDGQAESSWQGVESLAPDPSDPNRVYAAVGMYRRDPAAIMRSDDRGEHWQVFPVPFRMGGNEDGRGIGERLAVDPNQTSILYFGSRHDGLQRSSDRGAHWSKVASFPLPGLGTPPPRGPTHAGLSFVALDPSSGAPGRPTRTILVASADPGARHLFRSDDAGAHWTAVPGEPRADLLPVRAEFDDGGVLYIAYANGPGPNGATDGAVYRLDVSSGAWTDITPDKRTGRPAGGYMGLTLDRRRPGTVMVATLNRWKPGDTIWRSNDGGASWRSLRELSSQDVSATPFLRWGGAEASFGWWMAGLAIDPFDSDTAVYTTGATVYATHRLRQADRGGSLTWRLWVAGIEQTAVLNLTSPPQGAQLLSGFGDIGGFAHDDLDRSPATMFTDPVFNNTNNIDVAALNPRVVVRSGVPHDEDRPGAPRLAYSEDGARTWRALTPPRPADAPLAPNVWGRSDPVRDAAVVASAEGRSIVVTYPTPLVSRDKGASWRDVQGLPRFARPVPDRADPSRFYALDFETGRLFVSRDGGLSFAESPTAGLPPDLRADRPTWREVAWPLRAAPTRPGDLWFVSRRGLFHSTDGGRSFTRSVGTLQVEMLDFGKAPPGRSYPALFAIGTRADLRAVWRSDDAGASWIRVNDAAHEWGRRFRCIAGDPRVFGRVYVGTDGRGILYGEPAS